MGGGVPALGLDGSCGWVPRVMASSSRLLANEAPLEGEGLWLAVSRAKPVASVVREGSVEKLGAEVGLR